VGEQDVVRLDVAVHDATLVRIAQRAADIAQDAHGLRNGKRSDAREPAAERFPFHERHCVVGDAICLAGGEHRDDLRLLEARGELDLALEAVDVDARQQIGRQHLHHDLPPQRGLLGQEHRGHASPAELALEEVGRP
jgi:hypothetical protein